MQRKFGHLALVAFLATAISGYGVAWADDDDDDDDVASQLTGDDDDDDDDDDDGGSSASPAPSGGDSAGGGGYGSLGGYKMAISTVFPTGGDATAANLLYGLSGDNYLNISAGLNLVKEDATIFGIQLGAGYRMYSDAKGRIRPYIEPGLVFSVDDFGAFADTLQLAAYGALGVDLGILDQFTLGAGLGAGLVFANKFSNISFGLFTASINATFWW